MASNHSILFLIGCWHQPIHYNKLIESLRDEGFRVICHTHPTMTGPKSLADDHALARFLAEHEIEKGRTVDVLTHSYGGTVAAGAFNGLGLKARAAEGKAGGVRKLIGISSAWVAPGHSLMTLFDVPGVKSRLSLEIKEDGFALPTDPVAAFYDDLTTKDQEFGVKYIVPNYIVSQGTPVENPCWSDFEDFYFLKCLKDKALKPAYQDLIIKNLEEHTGKKIKVTDVDRAHSPFFFDEGIAWVKGAVLD